MRKKTSALLLSLCSLLSAPLQASWYEITGNAIILESESLARQNALEDAVFQATSYAGADIANIGLIKPYLEDGKRDYHFSGNEIRHISVTKTEKKGGKYYLTARIEIAPSAKNCHRTQYKKGLLLGEFAIAYPQHAALGSIYQLGDDFTQLFNRQLNKNSQSFVTAGITPFPVNPGQPDSLTMMAEDNDAQYIVSGEITDLTSTVDNQILRTDKINRQFAATLMIIDGKTGEILMQNNYREVANWPFSRTSLVDTKSARFWQSGYGQAIVRVSRNMMLDLESTLSCRTSLPEVVSTRGNAVQINVGRIHGVRAGDQLALWHSAGFIDQNGIPRNRMVQTNITLTVDRVYEKSSELVVRQPELAASIQPGDLLTKQLRTLD